MQLKRKKRQAGDTLVEVLLAFSIFGAAATTITRTMNEGYSKMFISGQQSQTQALMKGQLAIVQAAHDAEVKDPNTSVWDNIIAAIADTDSTRRETVNADGCTYTINKNRIYFITAGGATWTQPQKVPAVTDTAHQAVTATTVTPKPDGTTIWIEAKYTPPNLITHSRGYYDFYVKGCWSDGSINRQLKTVTRLYDLVAPPGEGSPITPSPPPATPIVVDPIQFAGNPYRTCLAQSPEEGNEALQSAPSGPLFSSPSYVFPCQPHSGGVYSCTNYDVDYNSQVVVAGRYTMTVGYLDALCGSASSESLNTSGGEYYYRVEVYRNGVKEGSMALDPNLTQGTFTFNSLNPGDVIGFRWWNNRFIGFTNKDPDFILRNVRLDYLQ